MSPHHFSYTTLTICPIEIMPTSNKTPNTQRSTSTSREPSDNEVVRDVGFCHVRDVMLNYNLKDFRDGDQVAEMKAIRDGLRMQNYEGGGSGMSSPVRVLLLLYVDAQVGFSMKPE
jgi:hypothetical protein